jgi:hypothetical protein
MLPVREMEFPRVSEPSVIGLSLRTETGKSLVLRIVLRGLYFGQGCGIMCPQTIIFIEGIRYGVKLMLVDDPELAARCA